MVTEVTPVHPSKAYDPILVTLLGMDTEIRLEQPEKAYDPILFTSDGISRSMISVFSSLYKWYAFDKGLEYELQNVILHHAAISWTITFLNPEQP